MSLYATPSRLTRLRQVDVGNVYREGAEDYAPGHWKVTNQMREMERAGWVKLESAHPHLLPVWHLTAAGRAVLDAAVTS